MKGIFSGIGLLVARIPVGLIFLTAGYRKLTAEGGTGAFVDKALDLAKQYMPENLAKLYLQAVPMAELVLGAMLIVGLLTRATGALVAAMLVSFTIAAHGHEWTSSQGPFLHANITMAAIAAMYLFTGGGALSADHALVNALFGKKKSQADQA